MAPKYSVLFIPTRVFTIFVVTTGLVVIRPVVLLGCETTIRSNFENWLKFWQLSILKEQLPLRNKDVITWSAEQALRRLR